MKFINEIAELIAHINPFIVFCAKPIIEFTTVLKAPPMAFPIIEPIFVKVDFIVCQISEKNIVTLENADFTAL